MFGVCVSVCVRARATLLCTKINNYIYYFIAIINIPSRGAHISQKFSSQLKNLSAGRMTGRKFRTEDKKILEKKLEVTVQTLKPTATWRQGFLHPPFNAWWLEAI